jgi:hypothetical protein
MPTLIMDGTNSDFRSRSNTVGGAIRSMTMDGGTFAKWTWNETSARFETTDQVYAPSLRSTGDLIANSSTANDILLLTPANATSTNSQPLRVTTSGSHPLGIIHKVFNGLSSREFKVEISPLSDSDEILNNQPVTFHDKYSRQVLGDASVLQIGMIAEDFSETGPISDFYTVRDENGKIISIQYDLLSTALISAGRVLRSRIDNLEARIAELES